MRKNFIGIGIVVLAVSALALLAAVSDEITIADCADKKAPVVFPHKAHEGVGPCSTCHHTQPDLEAGGEGQKCGDCHNSPEDAATPSCGQMSMTKNHYHINCVGCHKAEEKGPTKCNDCHPKE